MNKYIIIGLMTIPFFANADSQSKSLETNSAYQENKDVKLEKPIQSEITLSSDFSQKVQQDFLTITLNYQTSGANSKTVQNDINKKVKDAQDSFKTRQDGDKFKSNVSQISVQPNYEKGKIAGWYGSATITLSGTDVEALSQASVEPKGFTISDFNFSVSKTRLAEVKKEVIDQAIKQFKQDASNISHSFGYDDYQIKNVSVNYNGQNVVRPYMMNSMAKSAVAESIAPSLAPDTTDVSATVNGVIVIE